MEFLLFLHLLLRFLFLALPLILSYGNQLQVTGINQANREEE